MTAQLYNKWKRSIMDGDTNSTIVDDATNGPFVALVDTGVYTIAQTHQFYATTLTSPNSIVGTDQRITPTATFVGSTDGVFDGGDVTYTAVTGTSVEALVIYRHSASANTTWRLMSYYDTVGGGLPVTPNGGNITVQWNALGIFQLSDALAKHEIRQVGNIGPLGLYEYKYRVPESPTFLGFIAQEVERLISEAVALFGGYRHVNYARALCRAIQ